MDQIKECAIHGLNRHFARKDAKSWRCRACASDAVVKRRKKVKAILVSEQGGCCSICGYDRCSAALDFHHVDPTSKSFGIAYKGNTKGIEYMRQEAKKCVLLCKNCHAEVEAGVTFLGGEIGSRA